MINLFDSYNQSSWDLHYSLVRSGYDHPTIAIHDDGFLPEDVTSPFLYYTGFANATGHPLYFNQVKVPEFWEIRGDGSQGEIFDYDQKRGHIHYAEPKHNRLVKAVDWYDAKGRHRVTDHYNKFGYRYAQTTHNLNGEAVVTSYFTDAGQEVIVDNHVTGDLLLTDQGQVRLFKNRIDFILHYLKTAGFELDSIFYNSLSHPFLAAFYLGGEGKDILFWQEPIGDTIPGNMKLLLEDKGRQTKIMVQDKTTYEKILPLLTLEEQEKVSYLGYLYPFKDEELDYKQALILTNSDQLEQIDAIIQAQPEIHFHIGAITEMSQNLTRLASHRHVSLYPNIAIERARQLFKTCGIYLDINHHNEILSAIRTAFEHNLVIIGFEQTLHNRQYTAESLIFSNERIAELNNTLATISQNQHVVDEYIAQQKEAANNETINRYQELLD